MEKTLIGIFDDFTQAVNTVADLVQAGVPSEHISVVSPDREGEFARYLNSSTEPPVVEDAGIGAVLGGLGGWLVGLGLLSIPGIGPVVAAGPLFTALTGALVGAEAGSLVGVLHGFGVADYEAKSHAKRVSEGKTLVLVKTEEQRVNQVEAVLRQHRASAIEQRVV